MNIIDHVYSEKRLPKSYCGKYASVNYVPRVEAVEVEAVEIFK